MSEPGRTILHCDMDAFYASVEQLDTPDLRGRPVLVGGDRQRGVVCACSYEARPFGIRSGMGMAQALRCCPHAVVRPVRMDRYREVSEKVFALFHRFSDLVEPLSVDEAFMDVTASRRLFGDGMTIAQKIRGAVRRELELPVSVGVAPNKFLAKLCSEEAKPDGVHELKQEAVQSYLAALPLERIWGLGPKGVAKLKALGCRTVAQAQKLSCNQLRSLFGIQGERLYDLLRGRDDRPVVGDRERKSIGAEETFARDLIGQEELEGQLWRLAEQVCRRARRLGLGGTVGTLKVRRADRSVRTRSHTFPEPVDRAEPLVRWAKAQLAGLHQGMPVRLLGLYLAGLAPANQMELFDETERYRRLNQARDRLCNRYGDAILTRASLIGLSGSVQRGTHGLEDGD